MGLRQRHKIDKNGNKQREDVQVKTAIAMSKTANTTVKY